MVTTNAARALGLGDVLGSLEVGKKADVMVIGGDRALPTTRCSRRRRADVRLVMVGGARALRRRRPPALGPATPGCEPLDVCGAAKFVCVAAPGGDGDQQARPDARATSPTRSPASCSATTPST